MKRYTIECVLKREEPGCAANFRVYINYGGSETWHSYSPLLALLFKGKWVDSDLKGGVPSGGSAYLDERSELVFNLTDFKGRELTPYKVGKQGQGRFINSPIPLGDNNFDWELVRIE